MSSNQKLEQKLSGINYEIQQCMIMFNALLKDFSELLLKQFPDELLIKSCHEFMKELVFNIYKNKVYRENIIKENDEFFKNPKNINNMDDKLFFQFTNYWDKLNKEKQAYIKSVLKTMIEISEQYIIKCDDGNIIIEKIQKQHSKN